MTDDEIERESFWVRLGRAMAPGLCAISMIAGMPPWRAGTLAAYGSGHRQAPTMRQPPTRYQQAQQRSPRPEGAAR
jgi:hypothetical protein